MRTVLVCLLVVASVTALDKPVPAKSQTQEKRAAYPQSSSPAPPPAQPAGYPGSGVVTLPQGQGGAFPEAPLLNQVQQQAAIPKNVFINQQQPAPESSSTAAPSGEGLSSEALERIEQKSHIVEQTSNHIDEHVEIPIPTPYAVYENKPPVNKPYPVSAQQAVQFQAPQSHSAPAQQAVQFQAPQSYSAPAQQAVQFQAPQSHSAPAQQAVQFQAPQSYFQSAPAPLPYAIPQQYTFSQQFAIPSQSYSFAAPQVQYPSYPFLPVYSSANSQQFHFPSAPVQISTQPKSAIPPPAPLGKEPQPGPQPKTANPTQPPTINEAQSNSQLKTVIQPQEAQPLQLSNPGSGPQIFYNGAPTTSFNLPTVYSTAKPIFEQPAFNFAQSAYSVPQSTYSFPQTSFSLAQPAFSFPQASFSLPQPAISLPIFSARQLNVELSPISPTTVAPITFDATPTPIPLTINTATPAPLHFQHIVTSTPAPITLNTVEPTYDGPSHSYLPADNSIKK